MCSALCNESVLRYNPDKRSYEKIGESTEVALRVLAEKIGLPGFDSMPSALDMLSRWTLCFLKVHQKAYFLDAPVFCAMMMVLLFLLPQT
nr:Calcium-transporting ATPase 3, endoplasmic reticulum-type [Ipomoea batatas]